MEPEYYQQQSEMNVLFVHSALDDAGLSVEAFRLICHIVRRTKGGDPNIMPGRASMLRVTGLTKRKYHDAMDELVHRQFLLVEHRDGKVNRYVATGPSKWLPKVEGEEWKYTASLRKKRREQGLPCDPENDRDPASIATRSQTAPGHKQTQDPATKCTETAPQSGQRRISIEGNPVKGLPDEAIASPAPAANIDVQDDAPRPASKNPPRRNVAFDALVEIDGATAGTMTKVEGGRIGKCLADIRAAWPTKLPDSPTPAQRAAYEAELAAEIRGRARRYREIMPHAQLTATALVAHWSKCVRSTPSTIGQPLAAPGSKWALPDGCPWREIAKTLGIRVAFDTPWHEVSHAHRAAILEAHAAGGFIS